MIVCRLPRMVSGPDPEKLTQGQLPDTALPYLAPLYLHND